LGDLADRLHSAPIRDEFDGRSVYAMRDKAHLGAVMLSLIIQVSADMYDEASASLGLDHF
jgi:hypothetical protein